MIKNFVKGIACVLMIGVFAGASLGCETKTTYDNKSNGEKITSEDGGETKNSQIYYTYKGEECFAVDPHIPSNLFEREENSYVIKVKVESIGDTLFLEETEKFYGVGPYTPINITVSETLYGDKIEDLKTIYLSGGQIKISELIKKLDKASIEKMGFDELSKSEQESKDVSYETDYDYDLKVGEEYVVILARQDNNAYTIMTNGYGIFKEDAATKEYKNVLTDVVLTYKDGTIIK